MKKIFNFIYLILLLCIFSCSKQEINDTINSFEVFDETENSILHDITTTETAYESIEANETYEVPEIIKYDTEDLLILDDSESKNIDEKILFDDKKKYPKVDGSTALLPLMAQVRSRALGINLDEAENDTSCTKTNFAWYNLYEGNADILIVGEMPKEVKDDLEYQNKLKKSNNKKIQQILYAPVRREGLVFIVNKNNPVESLTRQQLIDIYTGKITNWKEVGGNDANIEAFQREEKSGSQTIFRKILMKDIEPTKKESWYYVADMNELIEEIASYDNTSNAIGYSVYYFVTQMHKNENVKILKIDDIMPSNETIADFSYPLLNESYVAIRADEPLNSDTRKLYDYIRSNQGKQAAMDAGYVPVK